MNNDLQPLSNTISAKSLKSVCYKA